MAKEPELMMAVLSFAGNEHEVRKGLQLPSDHELVRRFPKYFVPVAAGEEAAIQRAREIERATEALREKQREELRDARIRQGAKFDASDDVTVESTKRAVRNNPDLELVHDPRTGLVLGAQTKTSALDRARQNAEKAQRDGSTAMAQQAAAQQAAREA